MERTLGRCGPGGWGSAAVAPAGGGGTGGARFDRRGAGVSAGGPPAERERGAPPRSDRSAGVGECRGAHPGGGGPRRHPASGGAGEGGR
ncbi:MAG: hypothetical protein EB126_10045 [Synechococcaceae bacterium WBB_10_009]|nr:hypothetical protein [Synechococcaceae bacterium WBB_10_009]